MIILKKAAYTNLSLFYKMQEFLSTFKGCLEKVLNGHYMFIQKKAIYRTFVESNIQFHLLNILVNILNSMCENSCPKWMLSDNLRSPITKDLISFVILFVLI